MKNKISLFLNAFLLASLFYSCQQINVPKNNPSKPSAKLTTIAPSTFIPLSNLIYEETFEGPTPFSTARALEIGPWDYALQFVTSPVLQGLKAARFEIRQDQPLVQNGKRAEVVIVNGALGDITNNAWYSFAAYFPSSGYELDTAREIISQWYQDGIPSTSLRTQNDKFLLETGNKLSTLKRIRLGPITKDTWQEFVFHFIHAHDSTGLIELWHNGINVLTLHRGNMYKGLLPKWKIGLYKASFKSDSAFMVTKRIIYFDNVRVGNANATYSDMAPLIR